MNNYSPTIDEILKSIRNVINDSDVLVMEKDAKDSAATNTASTEPVKTQEIINKDVKVDDVFDLVQKVSPVAEIKVAPGVSEEPKKPELTETLEEKPASDTKMDLKSVDDLFSDVNKPQEVERKEAPKAEAPKVETEAPKVETEAPKVEIEAPKVEAEASKIELDTSKKQLVSNEVASATLGAIKTLVQATTRPADQSLKFRSGVTVEELVIEAIKPQLAKWLDDHLPTIVKNLVEKEIKRLIPSNLEDN
jgi:cell pole-organizing protein PopZ